MKLIVGVLSAIALTTGCASITTSEHQTINITTSNNKATEVIVDDQTVTTPGTVTVLRNGADKVAFTHSKECDSVTPIKKEVTPVFMGNIIFGGVFGSTTDGITGKMWDYEDSVEISCPE